MRVALLANRSSIHTVRWVNGLAAHGHEVHLLSSHRIGERLDQRVTFHELPFAAPAGYYLNTHRARTLLRELRPDILNTHFASGYGTLGRLSGFRPNVLSVWGRDVYHFPNVSFLHRAIVRANLRRASWVCSTSHAMARQTDRLASIPHLSVVPFGVDADRFCPETHGRSSPEVVIGTVKTLAPKYGVDLLLRAFAEVRHTLSREDPGLSSRLRLHVVGDGPARASLEALATALNVQSVCRFFGFVPHDTVADHLRSLDVYVALSREDSESFGVAVIEASACGLPVVVSDVGGLPEVVDDGGSGYVVARENHRAAAEVIKRLVTDPELRAALGRGGRKRVSTLYSWSASVSAMTAVYENAINLGSGRRAGDAEDADSPP